MSNKIEALLKTLGESADDTGCTDDLVVVSRSTLFEATQACQRLAVVAQRVLENIIDADEYGPYEHPDYPDRFVADEDGDLWYPEVWELREALFGDGTMEATEAYPTAHVSAEVADAFGMRGLPNTIVHE